MTWGTFDFERPQKNMPMNYNANKGDLGLTKRWEIEISIDMLEKSQVFVNNCFGVAIFLKWKGFLPVKYD